MCVLLAFAMRLHALATVPLRGDEAHTVNAWVEVPLHVTIERYAVADPHPPLAYALFNGWGQLFGTGEFVMRLLPALLSVLSIPALYGIGSQLGGRTLGLFAAILWTLHPFILWHAQDARNYAIWSSLSALAVWLALLALQRRRWQDWVLYVVAAALAVYVYYLEVFVLVALNAYVLLRYWRRWRVWAQWAAAQIAIGLIMAPWYLQPHLAGGGGYIATGSGFDLSDYWTRFLPVLAFGDALPGYVMHVLWQVLVLALLLALLILLWRAPRKLLLPLLLGVLPLMLLGVLSTRMDVFRPRYVLGAAPALTLLWALLIWALWEQAATRKPRNGQRVSVKAVVWRTGALLLLLGWLGLSWLSIHYYRIGPPKAPDWRGITDYLEARVAPEDVVVQAATDAAFGYYYDGAAPDTALPATSEQTATEIHAALADLSTRHPSLWVAARTQPYEPNAGVVDAWLADNMQMVRDTQTGVLPVREFRLWQVGQEEQAALPDTPLATFGDGVVLRAAYISPLLEPTGELTLWLYWQPEAQTRVPHKVFVHLVDETGRVLTQDDQFPQNGRINTTTWEADTLYRDVYMLPDVPTVGSYALVAGLYDPESGERLLNANGTDQVVLGRCVDGVCS